MNRVIPALTISLLAIGDAVAQPEPPPTGTQPPSGPTTPATGGATNPANPANPALPTGTGTGTGTGDAPPPAVDPAAPAGGAKDAAAPKEEENLLSSINNDTGAANSAKNTDATFGKELRFFGLETNWSGYGDLTFSATPNQKTYNFDLPHFNPVLSVRMSDTLSAEMELEIEHGGITVQPEYAMIDWTPTGSRELVIRAGKFLIPFGRYNEQLHPSFRWSQIDRPLMMNEVVPVEWNDVGLQIRGQLRSGDTTFDYAAYVVNGLNEHANATTSDELLAGFIGNLKSNLADSNADKGAGGRVAITSSHSKESAVSLGVSGYTGRTSPANDPDGAERLTMADVDLYAREGGLLINAEGCVTFFGSNQINNYFQSFERGAYLQLAYIIGKLTLASRYDYVSLGGQQHGIVNPLVDHHQIVSTIKYAPAPTWAVRLEVAQPISSGVEAGGAVAAGYGTSDTKISSSLSFVF